MKIEKLNNFNFKTNKFILDLRNKEYVRKYSLSKKKILIKDHLSWLSKFKKNNNKFFLIKNINVPIGYIRSEKIRNINYLSWALLKNFHNKGIMSAALNKIIKNKKKFRAIIKKNNANSLKLVKKLGFKKKTIKKNYYIFYK